MKEKDVKGVIKRQKRYATLAEQEGKYAEKIAKKESSKHLPEMAKDSKQEAKVAFSFANKRRKIVQKEKKKLKEEE